MRVFCKFYPDIEVISFNIDSIQSISEVKQAIYGLTNLGAEDDLRVIFRGAPLRDMNLSLWDLGAREDETLHIVIEKLAAADKKFHVLRPKQQFNQLRDLSDQSLVTLLSFLDAPSLAACSRVYRRWKNASMANHALYRFNCEKLFRMDSASCNPAQISLGAAAVATEGKDEEEAEEAVETAPGAASAASADATKKEHTTVLPKGSHHEFKTWFVNRYVARKTWKHAAKMSRGDAAVAEHIFPSSSASHEDVVSFKKGRVMEIKKKPKEFTDEEKQFIKDNTVMGLKKLLRKDKTAREKLKRLKTLLKRQDEIENGLWQYVPAQYVQFNYEVLANHALGFNGGAGGANAECFDASYHLGRFFFTKDGQTVFVAEVEPEGTDFKFTKIVVEEGAPEVYKSESPKADTQTFFTLLEQTGCVGTSVKRMVDIVAGDQQSIAADAAVYVKVAYPSEFVAGTTQPVECLKLEEFEPEQGNGDAPVSPRVGRRRRHHLPMKQFYTVTLPLYDSEEASSVNAENIRRVYAAAIAHAKQSDSIAILSVPCVESQVIASENGGNIKAALQQEEGKLFAQAVKQALSDHAVQTQATAATTEQTQDTVAASTSQVTPKKLEKVLLLANDAGIVARVLSNMKSELNSA